MISFIKNATILTIFILRCFNKYITLKFYYKGEKMDSQNIFYGIIAITGIVIALVLSVCFYFLPSIIAYKKNHANKLIILVINLLLGWTLLGWGACLVWALVDTDGSVVNKTFRNVGGNKYEDLEKLQKLKQSGAITDEEFKIEKEKLLR